MRRLKIRKIFFLASVALYLLTVGAICYLNTLNLSFWLLFFAGFAFILYCCELRGGVFYAFLTGLFALVYSYVIFVYTDYITPEELVIFYFSIMAEILLMILLSVIVGGKFQEYRRETERVRSIAVVDQLTGLKNYGYFIERLREEREKADRRDSVLSLLMIDIDYFKDFNDRFGHQRGNEVLETIATKIKSVIREKDTVCRYGGEEFAVILPDTPPDVAYEIAERIRSTIASLTFYGDRLHPRVSRTVSIGVATYPVQARDEYELIDMADRALYFAKESGRNQVKAYDLDVERFWFKLYA